MLKHFEFFNRFAIWVSSVVFQFVTIDRRIKSKRNEKFYEQQ